jgi:hypothetical protein
VVFVTKDQKESTYAEAQQQVIQAGMTAEKSLPDFTLS